MGKPVLRFYSNCSSGSQRHICRNIIDNFPVKKVQFSDVSTQGVITVSLYVRPLRKWIGTANLKKRIAKFTDDNLKLLHLKFEYVIK